MKSISALTTDIVAQAGGGTSGSLTALAPRPAPLTSADIAKLEDAIQRHFVVTREPRYGNRPVIEDGQLIRHEFDVIGEDVSYQAKPNMPRQLLDAMLRPAQREHVIYHLGRLAAHRRDTRGDAGLQVVFEDLSRDLRGISELAVVWACTEMRQKNATWYPNSGEVVQIIRKNDHLVRDVVNRALAGEGLPPAEAVKTLTADPRLSMSYRELDRKDWLPCHYAHWIADAQKMVDLYVRHGNTAKADEWRELIAKRQAEALDARNLTSESNGGK